jgi:mRNA-degrading endonuclease RelE of RelBE toxin-antitoxin system
MRKVIDIPDEIVKDLKKLAIDQDKDLKNFIQDELKKLVENSKSKPS